MVARKPDESLLIQAIRYEGLEMPPDKPLPASVVNDFVRWVQRGATDPRDAKSVPAQPDEAAGSNAGLWSVQPVQDPPLPAVKNAAWPRDPLDRFVLSRIEAAGLAPTGDAEPRTLVRRMYFDLIGLPPMWSEIEEFVADQDQHGAAAVDRLVDRLLARPQFGGQAEKGSGLGQA